MSPLERVGQLFDHRGGDVPRGHHHPDNSRGGEPLRQLTQRGHPGGPVLPGHRLDRVGVVVVDHAVVSTFGQAADDIRTHPAQTDHS